MPLRLDMASRHQQMSMVLWTCNTWDEREIQLLQDGHSTAFQRQQYPLWIQAYMFPGLALPAICGHAPPNCNRTLASATLRNNRPG
jgi:cyclopropane fatty-acyl-phospholipid synthase-like methyltransferase